jgi:ADP-ribose pyrophosphatase YjhB (NUDIX family)
MGMTRKISVRAIVLHEGKLLCARLKPYEGSMSVAKGEWWCLPGGGLEEDEALLDGIKREMLEETGIEPVVGNLLYVQQFRHKDTDYLEFFFHVTNAEDYLHVNLEETTHGMIELAEIGFIDPKSVPLVMPKFLATEDLVAHASGNNPTKFFAQH